MARFLMLWTLDKTFIPADPKERSAGWGLLMEMIKQDMDKGVVKDWGVFPSEPAGFCIMEGNTVEVMTTTEQYSPYVDFENHLVANVDQTLELIKNLSGEG